MNLKRDIYFVTYLEAEESKVKVLADSISGEVFLKTTTFSLMVEEASKKLSGILFF